MKLREKIRDFIRGYSDADLTSALEKVLGEPTPGAWVVLKNGEFKALTDKKNRGMHYPNYRKPIHSIFGPILLRIK